MKKNNKRKIPTIQDWKKRALKAEKNLKDESEFTLVKINNANNYIKDLENQINNLNEELGYKSRTIHELDFEAMTARKQVNNLQRLLEFVSERIPQEYYHNCFENVKYSSQTVEATSKNTINYDKNEAKIESSSNE